MADWVTIQLNIDTDWKKTFDLVLKDVKHIAVIYGLCEDDEDITGPFRWPECISSKRRFELIQRIIDQAPIVEHVRSYTQDW